MDNYSAIESQSNGKRSTVASWRTHLSQDVDKSWTDVILLVTCFLTGLTDSAVFNVWSCFVGMQTGNTVYTGLGVSGQPASQPYRWAKSGTSILGFCIGTYFFSRMARTMGPLRRGTMALSSLLQAALCFASATLVLTGVVAEDAGSQIPKNCIVLLPLSMLAFNSAGQIVQSRFLGFNEVPTVVLTSTYCDLVFDPLLFTAPLTENSKRNRRFLSAVVLLLGAVLGGFLTQNGKIENAIWIAGAFKVITAGVWIFWRGEGSIRLD